MRSNKKVKRRYTVVNEYEVFLINILRNQSLAALFKLVGRALQNTYPETAEEVKAIIFENYDRSEETMQTVKNLLNGLKEALSVEKISLVCLEMILCRNVDGFNYYLSQMLKRVFLERPEILRASDNSIQVCDVLQCSNIDEIILKVAERKVEKLGYESLKSIIKYLNEKLNLDFDERMPDYLDSCETFQVRNIIVHNAGIVNELFLQNTRNTDLKIGEPFPLTEEYVFNSGLKLNNFAVALDKQFKSHFRLEP